MSYSTDCQPSWGLQTSCLCPQGSAQNGCIVSEAWGGQGICRLHWQGTQVALTVLSSPSPSSHPHPRHLWGWLYFYRSELLPAPYKKGQRRGAFCQTPSCLCPCRPHPQHAQTEVPFGELAGVPVLVHHELGDLDRQGAALLRGEAVPAQHHAVGSGGTGRKEMSETVSSRLSGPLSAPSPPLGRDTSVHCLGGLALDNAGVGPSMPLVVTWEFFFHGTIG